MMNFHDFFNLYMEANGIIWKGNMSQLAFDVYFSHGLEF